MGFILMLLNRMGRCPRDIAGWVRKHQGTKFVIEVSGNLPRTYYRCDLAFERLT